MASVKIESVLEHLDSELSRALEDTVRQVAPDASFNARSLYRDFVRRAYRRCSVWEHVPDSYVKVD